MKRPDPTNVLAVLIAMWLGASCYGCTQYGAFEGGPMQPARLEFKNAHPILPGPFEAGVWAEVEAALHTRADINAIRLAVADSIFDLTDRRLLYGVYAYVDWSDGTFPTVVVDRIVRWSARVWSHEFCHVIGGFADGDYRLTACVLRDGPYVLPERPLPERESSVPHV